MYILKYRVKKKRSGLVKMFYTTLKPMLIIFKTKEKAQEKMKDIKEWINNSNGYYILDYIKLDYIKLEDEGIEFDKIYFEEFEESEVK